jgi:hypothetical protein
MATETKIVCDIKGCKQEVHGYGKQFSLPVVFHTEQTEGRSTEPHFSVQTLDICVPHMKELLKSYPLHASGAQGYNDYRILKND